MFKKGNKFGKGGARKGSGRKTNKEREQKLEADERIRRFIDKHLEDIMLAYLDNAKGHYEKRFNDKGIEYEMFVIDPATTRHAIDRFVPPAKQEFDVTNRHTVVFETINPNAERRRKRLELLEEQKDGG